MTLGRSDPISNEQRRPGTVRTVIGFALLVALAVSILALSHVIKDARQRVRQAERGGKFREVLYWLKNETSERLPASVHKSTNGEPLFSWRLALTVSKLPLGELDPAKPWQDPVHARFAKCGEYGFTDAGSEETFLMGVIGPNTAFGEERPMAFNELVDGQIIIIEVMGMRQHWMAPGDLDIRRMPTSIGQPGGIGSSLGHGFHVGFADGEVWYIADDIPFATLLPFFTAEGARKHDREHVLAAYRLAKVRQWGSGTRNAEEW
jgi:hypothetical protein